MEEGKESVRGIGKDAGGRRKLREPEKTSGKRSRKRESRCEIRVPDGKFFGQILRNL